MSFLSSLGSSLLGTVSNTLAGHWSAKQNASLSRDNWRYMQQNAHQYEVQDLRAAGLNPILSATNSQIAGMSSVSSPSVSDNGSFSALTQAASAKALKAADVEIENKKLENDLKRIDIEKARLSLDEKLGENTIKIGDSTISVNNARTQQINSDIENAKKMVEAQVKSILDKLPFEIDKLVADASASRAAASLSLKNVELVGKQMDLTSQQIEKLKSDLSDPKKLHDRQWWNDVFNSKDPYYVSLRKSLERGMANDIWYSFYSTGSDASVSDGVELLSRIKYLLK